MNQQSLSSKQKDGVHENDHQRYNLLRHSEQNETNREDMNEFNRLNHEQKYTFLECKNNGHEDKKNEQFLSSNIHEISRRKQKSVTKSHYVHILIEKINQLQLTKHAIIMIILNILMIFILIIVFQLSRKSLFNISVNVEEVLVMKRGNAYGGPGGEKFWDDAEIATLTFNNTITRVTASQSVDLAGEPVLLSLTFGYSNERTGREYGGAGRRGKWEDLIPLELTPGERIDHITIYEGYRNITNPYREGKLTYIIVGIYFKTDHNQQTLYGSTNGIRKVESPNNYFLGYVQGQDGGYIDSLRFTWYKYCLKNSTISENDNF